jgi:hypothetical protein
MIVRRLQLAFAVVSIGILPLLAPREACAQTGPNPTKSSKKAQNVKPAYRAGGSNQSYKTASSAKAARVARSRASRAQAMRNYNIAMNSFGTPVAGGNFLPGYGVIGSPGTPVFGGTFIPGYGVTGIQGTPVFGGTYMPGYGVRGVGARQVHGGTYIPGYGVGK